jgi:hypothetical protein
MTRAMVAGFGTAQLSSAADAPAAVVSARGKQTAGPAQTKVEPAPLSTHFLAYFFPSVSPYNDTDLFSTMPGLDTEAFTYRLRCERFDDFANFNVSVTVSKNRGVWATGKLQNPTEVLQPEYVNRLEKN